VPAGIWACCLPRAGIENGPVKTGALLSRHLQFEQLAGGGQGVAHARKAQAMPRHRVVAGGDGNAGEAFEPGGGLGDAEAGAGDEDRLDPGRGG
jgi:hypothetical protein